MSKKTDPQKRALWNPSPPDSKIIPVFQRFLPRRRHNVREEIQTKSSNHELYVVNFMLVYMIILLIV